MSGVIQRDEYKWTIVQASKVTRSHQTGGHSCLRDKSIGQPAYWVDGDRHKGGVNLNRAFLWNCEGSEFVMSRDPTKRRKSRPRVPKHNPGTD